MVGVAAVQVPWHTVELSSGWDFTSHITALEAMLAEMQLRVRRKQSTTRVRSVYFF